MKNRPRGRQLRFWMLAVLSILLGGIMMFGLFGCGKTAYAVDYCGQKDDYHGARDTYKAGEKVKLTYDLVATDTDYTFLLDGEQLNADYKEGKGFILKFTMPDHDVKLECSAVNSMVLSQDGDEQAETMLVDLYTASVATDGGDSYDEMTLNTYASDRLRLFVYHRNTPEAEESRTTYIVPKEALERCYAVIDESKMRTWNDSAEPLDGEEGAITVCKFCDKDGTYYKVTSEAMPDNGPQAFSALREVLQSYAAEEYRQ